MIKVRAISLWSAVVFSMGAATPAFANTFSLTVGPILLSPVPLNVCNGNACNKTPALGNAKMRVDVTMDDTMALVPRIRPAACPAGQIGEALIVEAQLRDATVGGLITGNVGNLTFQRLIPAARVPAGRTVVLSACTF
jgi:hypothetical protein